MDGIQVTSAGRKLIFATTGDVVDVSGAGTVVRGKWQSNTAAKDNTIAYTIDGAAQRSLTAVYSFTDDNQLSMALKGDTTSSVFVFPGFIEVDHEHDFLYHLIDGKGAPPSLLSVRNTWPPSTQMERSSDRRACSERP
jgi:hypothetical protein